jgi:hypothetical protein
MFRIIIAGLSVFTTARLHWFFINCEDKMAMPAARAISGLLIAFGEPESAPHLFIVPLCFTIW